MRDAKPLAGAPDAAAKARARNAGAALASIEGRRIVFVDGAFVPELSDLAGLEAGLTIRSMAQALAAGDPQVTSLLGKVVPTDDVAVALNTAFMGDGAVIRVGQGAALARPIHLVFVNAGGAPAAVFTRSLVVDREGRARHAGREPRGRGRQRVSGQHRARARGRRRGPRRSHQDHRRGRRRAACLDA